MGIVRMRRGVGSLLLVLLGAIPAFAAPENGVRLLEDGRPVEVTLPAGRAAWTARIDVPADADALAVSVSADRNVDLYVRHGRPVGTDEAGSADAASAGDAHHEIVLLTPAGLLSPSGLPRIRSGAWFITVAHPFSKAAGVAFEIAVFVDRQEGRRTLLPGVPVTVNVPPPGQIFVMRTFLPRRAVAAVLDLAPPVVEGLRYRLEGPGGFRRRATTQERLVLGAEHEPSGVYAVSFATPAPSVRPPSLRAELTWSFPGGLILPRPASPVLEPDRPLPVLMGGPANGSVQPLRIPVGEGTGGFVLTATNAAGVNVDLYVRRGATPRQREEDAQWLGLSVGPSEAVVVAGKEPLPQGTYHAELLLVDDDKPVEVIVTRKTLDVGSGPYAWGTRDPPLLEHDTWHEGAVKVYKSAISWHEIEAPAGTTSLHAQLLGATGPLELLLVKRSDGSILGRAMTPLVDERLGVTLPGPLEETERFLIGVLNRATWDEEVSYRMAIGLDAPPELPEDMPWPPSVSTEGLNAQERAAAATVEITIGDCSGGSGVCLTPDGLVLSCRHCLKMKRGSRGLQTEGILVAFPERLDRPPVQSFFAKIVAEDVEQDLVLLEPLKDVFGRPLPADVLLPSVPLGESRTLRLGQSLWVCGYPQMGSECTRTAVVLSRGILAGMERRAGKPAWLKTDAWVAPGHSGGPVVDEEGRLVGIAAATLGQTESLGLAIPVSRLPAAWVTLIRERLPVPVGE